MKNERIKVLLTEDSLPLGGAETQMLQVLEHLDRGAFDVHLLTLRNRGELLPEARGKADQYACVNRRIGLDLSALYRMRGYVTRNSIAILHTNQWLDSLYGLIACHGLRIKRIGNFQGFASRGWRLRMHLWSVRHFDRLICPSRSSKIDLLKFGIPWEKSAVVSNCYDHKRFAVANCLRNNESGTFHIGMVGNFV
jgi:glycosyltransferase involved in cell wall biosynthesis